MFDILPLSGSIYPDQAEKIEFSYLAIANKKFEIIAVCRVSGGPDYFVKIKSEASEVNYRIHLPYREKFINLKEVNINARILQYFEIENTSKVTFEYSIRLDPSIKNSEFMRKFISIVPSRGKIQGGERTKVRLYIIPGIPDELLQVLVVQVSHFEPEKIVVKGMTLFPTLRLDLDRRIDFKLGKLIEEIQRKKSKVNNQHFMLNSNESLDEYDNDHKNTEQMLIGFEKLVDFMELDDNDVVQVEKEIVTSYVKNNIDYISSSKKIDDGIFKSSRVDSKTLVQRTVTRIEEVSRGGTLKDFRFGEDLVLGVYFIGLGNIIAGTKTSRTIRVRNIGSTNASYNIDVKMLKNIGISLTNPKVSKFAHSSNNIVEMVLTYSTKRSMRSGSVCFKIPMVIDNGPKYIIEVNANIIGTIIKHGVCRDTLFFILLSIIHSTSIFPHTTINKNQ